LAELARQALPVRSVLGLAWTARPI